MNIVPNLQPRIKTPNKICVIGEAPGEYEITRGEPFSGPSGYLLTNLMSRAGIVRDACFIGNVCQHRPKANDFSQFDWFGDEIQTGIERLRSDVESLRPNIILCLGNASFHLAKNGNTNPIKRGEKYIWSDSISNWRGSLIWSDFFHCKAMGSYHPAACLRNYEWTPILHFDLLRLASESRTPDLSLPVRQLSVNLTSNEIIDRLTTIKHLRRCVSVDIEGYVDAMSCISFATSAMDSFTIPFTGHHGGCYWQNEEEEVAIWQAMVAVLTDPNVPKVLQNSLYDRFVLQYSYGIPVLGVVDDTMLKHWEHYCELEKSLGFQTSIYTKEPFYKFEGKSDDHSTRLLYCAKDSAVTYEINNVLDNHLSSQAKKHYRFNVELLNPILYMELRGIRYDAAKAKQRHEEIQKEVYKWQAELDRISGYGIKAGDGVENHKHCLQEVLCFKRDPTQAKKGNEAAVSRGLEILKSDYNANDSLKGELSTLLNLHLNVGSNKQICSYLYETLHLPTQLDKKTHQPTASYEALLKLTKKTGHPSLPVIIELRTLTTRKNMLEIHADHDGRIRCGYNIVGTETGRLTCYTSPTGSGYNLQTIPSDNSLKPAGHPLSLGMRDLFTADPGHYLFQCDLSGADGWTVAAHCASLGDRTMLDDYLFGLKPAKIACLGLRGETAYLDPACSREAIRDACRRVEKDSWDYFACKRAQHGTNYLMGPQRLAEQILVDSEGAFVITKKEVGELQQLYLRRYRGVLLWHQHTQAILSRKPVIVAASGHRRYFFGRKDEILGEALAHEPQANTTYATNLAAWRLWSDPDNRTPMGLRVEPLHQVHDALLGQFKIEDTSWAVAKIKSYFDNTLVIAGIPIKIPFEGQYGLDWSLNDKSKIGNI